MKQHHGLHKQHTAQSAIKGHHVCSQILVSHDMLLQLLKHLHYEQGRSPSRRIRQSILILQHMLEDSQIQQV